MTEPTPGPDEERLDALMLWLEHFTEQPGASLVPEWLEALRRLRWRERLASARAVSLQRTVTHMEERWEDSDRA